MTDYDLNNINLELKQNIIVKIKEKPAIEDLAFIIEQNQLFLNYLILSIRKNQQ